MRLTTLAALTAATTACSGGIDLDYTDSPLDTVATDAQFAAEVEYGEYERNVLDVFHFPDADAPTPLFIYIHGGGFTGGDKSAAYEWQAALPADFTNEGVAFATINYRLLEEVDTDGVIKSMTDSARALQYMRHYAEELNIDPDRITVGGASAGAGTAIWLATHDDLADAGADDPVLAESTRVRGAAAWETQASYDLIQWSDRVYVDFGIDLFETAAQYGLSQTLWSFYGITADEQLFEPEYVEYRENVDMLDLMTADDPPMWFHNVNEPGTYPLSVGALFHHPNHVRELAESATEAGIPFEAYAPAIEIGGAARVEPVPYLIGLME